MGNSNPLIELAEFCGLTLKKTIWFCDGPNPEDVVSTTFVVSKDGKERVAVEAFCPFSNITHAYMLLDSIAVDVRVDLTSGDGREYIVTTNRDNKTKVLSRSLSESVVRSLNHYMRLKKGER